jgi:DNA-binding transcriptional MerR regulator
MGGDSLRIGELARIAGVTPRTIRHYESLGLVSPRRREPSGYRRYDPSTVLVVAEIRRLRALGMSLSDIAVARRDGRDSTSLLARLDELKADIDREAADLEARRRALDELGDAVAKGEAILASGETQLFDSVRALLLEAGASERAMGEARRVFAALESLTLPDGWAGAVEEGLALVRENDEARRAWVEALDLVAGLRDASVDDPVVSQTGRRIAALAPVGATVRAEISFKDQASVAIAAAVASCFTPAQIAAGVTAAVEAGALT